MLKLRIGILPGESRPAVERLNEPLRAFLERFLGCRVELVVGSSYVATGEALRRKEIDIAYLGPVTYILQSRIADLEPFARPSHGGRVGPTFQAALVVPAENPVQTLAELTGQEIAFGDLISTSGAWVPRHMLLSAGLSSEQHYVRRCLGSHDAVVAAVATRQVAAGGLSLGVFRRLLGEGRVDPAAVRVLAESAPIPEYMWTFREGLPAALREDLRQAFVGLRDPAALAAYRAEAFIPAVDADVDRVRHWMEEILEARLQPNGARSLSGPAARANPLPGALRPAPTPIEPFQEKRHERSR